VRQPFGTSRKRSQPQAIEPLVGGTHQPIGELRLDAINVQPSKRTECATALVKAAADRVPLPPPDRNCVAGSSMLGNTDRAIVEPDQDVGEQDAAAFTRR
jgi:hypothetical protein